MKLQTQKINFSKKLLLSIAFFLIPLLSSLFPHHASAAVLYSQAANQNVYEGQTFVVDWYLNTQNESVNSIDLKLNFSKDVLKVSDATVGSSVVSLWIRKPYADNEAGTIELIGGVPNGFNAANVPIFRTTFDVVKSGIGTITMDPTSQVLRNDGSGEPAVLQFQNLSFTVQPKGFNPNLLSSLTHPDQNAWYADRNVVLQFNYDPAKQYSFSFSSNADIIPDNSVMPAEQQFFYNNLPDGVYYFKANEKFGDGAWLEDGIYRIQIDGSPPEEFEPIISSDSSLYDGKPFVSFSAVDKISGISHYMVKVGLFGKYKTAESPYKLTRPLVGDTIEIKAFDNAGNFRAETVPYAGYVSVLWFRIIIGVLAGVILAAILWLIQKQIAKKKIENKL
jgi:hypothetical protein